MTGDEPGSRPEDRPEELTPDIRAAEYVLGTLNVAEREEAQVMLTFDPVFGSLVRDWERRFGELHALADSFEPPPEVWEAIKARLPETTRSTPIRPIRLPKIPRPRPARSLPSKAIVLHKQVMRWRTFAAATGVMAVVFALFIIASNIAPGVLPDQLRPIPRVIARLPEGAMPAAQRFVAVLQRDDIAPAFILTVDIANRSLTVRRVAAEREADKSYELWLVSSKFPAPRSLGMIGEDDFMQSSNLLPYDPTTIADATFAISLEPEGGSPSGAPSNIMFTGKLVEAIPPRSPEAQ
jgi:anti-sigma-K factor RskA